jgi:hypothetical protein
MPENRGVNLALTSALALLSYVPFEYVAKGTLVVSAFLFVVDPIPPLSRLLSIVSLLIVFVLSRLYNQHKKLTEDEIIVSDEREKRAKEE